MPRNGSHVPWRSSVGVNNDTNHIDDNNWYQNGPAPGGRSLPVRQMSLPPQQPGVPSISGALENSAFYISNNFAGQFPSSRNTASTFDSSPQFPSFQENEYAGGGVNDSGYEQTQWPQQIASPPAAYITSQASQDLSLGSQVVYQAAQSFPPASQDFSLDSQIVHQAAQPFPPVSREFSLDSQIANQEAQAPPLEHQSSSPAISTKKSPSIAKQKYKCNICPGKRTFRSQNELNRHTTHSKSHRGDTPCYECSCGYKQSRKDNYIRHLQLNHPQDSVDGTPYRCNCGKPNSDKDTHIQHVKSCQGITNRCVARHFQQPTTS
ncbi:hypothetical protein GQX73_g2555 [Xylaria multiplex]|uniref:C2H2-type domain-containing protein n=1 Tax=Xylaria multiplex TaxID=323545 RepID=A0A7C8IVH5_9PEZI|nr:hypothetical protein GQX73_g2555 [Xylaria multiplex]